MSKPPKFPTIKVHYSTKKAFNGTTSIVKWEQLPSGDVRKKTLQKGLNETMAEEEVDRLIKRTPLKQRMQFEDEE